MSNQLTFGTCPKTFASRRGLFLHKQAHSGVKYNCPQCNKSFSQNGSLKRPPLFTVGRNRTSAHCATFRVARLPTSKHILRCTPGKNYITTINANIKHHNQATCKRTRRRTRVKSHRDVLCASIRAFKLLI